jgi:hypothetical protein
MTNPRRHTAQNTIFADLEKRAPTMINGFRVCKYRGGSLDAGQDGARYTVEEMHGGKPVGAIVGVRSMVEAKILIQRAIKSRDE